MTVSGASKVNPDIIKVNSDKELNISIVSNKPVNISISNEENVVKKFHTDNVKISNNKRGIVPTLQAGGSGGLATGLLTGTVAAIADYSFAKNAMGYSNAGAAGFATRSGLFGAGAGFVIGATGAAIISNVTSDKTKGTLLGAAGGAGLGAIIGGISLSKGNPVSSAIIITGALTGLGAISGLTGASLSPLPRKD